MDRGCGDRIRAGQVNARRLSVVGGAPGSGSTSIASRSG
jgi:DNA helicase IV